MSEQQGVVHVALGVVDVKFHPSRSFERHFARATCKASRFPFPFEGSKFHRRVRNLLK